MLSIDDVQSILDDIAAEIPEAFFQELNGGILLLPKAKMHPERLADDLYILGEYCRDHAMGRYISIYYGSFQRVFGYAGEAEWRDELKKTLLHEFTHHLESLAGERDLEIRDELELEDYYERRSEP